VVFSRRIARGWWWVAILGAALWLLAVITDMRRRRPLSARASRGTCAGGARCSCHTPRAPPAQVPRSTLGMTRRMTRLAARISASARRR
jgi:hypothetical protein